ncbi:MAG TPA: magnesium transporter CorA family protein [Verrucomicrobiae bacterium]|nr:magnesium transporter CorA family protein [Verrucomicrobiae bacterium]
MVTYYYKDVHSADLKVLEKPRNGTWVCVENPTTDEIDALVELYSLDQGHMSDALDVDEMPRLEREGDTTYIFVRYAYVNDDLELTTAPLLFVLHPTALLTVALHSLPRKQRFTGGRVDFSTTQHMKLLLQILAQIVDQYEVYINNISRRIKAIRTRLRTHEVINQDFIDFVTIEDELNEFLSGLQPTNAILRRLLVSKHVAVYDQDQEIVEDLLLNNEQSIESCRNLVKSIVNIREAHATITNNNLNRAMRTLTAATVIITLPNVFYGMFGMNVPIPFAHEPLAFAGVVGTTVVVTLLVVIIGRSKRMF